MNSSITCANRNKPWHLEVGNNLAKRYKRGIVSDACCFYCSMVYIVLVWHLQNMYHMNHSEYGVFSKHTTLVLSHQKFATNKPLALWAQVLSAANFLSDLGLQSYICWMHLLYNIAIYVCMCVYIYMYVCMYIYNYIANQDIEVLAMTFVYLCPTLKTFIWSIFNEITYLATTQEITPFC